MHPTLSIKGTKSSKLLGKKIVLGVTGSIAAVETLKLCRELIRHGANVHPVMSDSARQIITPHALHFACGREPVTWIDGRVQHVEFFSSDDRADLFVISPCTANTLSKIACGIDDTPVTTCATTALGAGVPILIVPAMDLSMWNHPILKKNIETLKSLSVGFIGPLIEEKKAKIVHYDRIIAEIIRKAGRRDFAGKKVLVIAGSTEEEIDDVRMITNKSTGETGLALAKSVYERGGDVELWMGRCEVALPDYIPTRRFRSTDDLAGLVKGMKKFDAAIMPAAVSDFTVKKQTGKLSSDKKQLSVTLESTPKIIGIIRKKFKGTLVGFKLESGVPRDALIGSALKKLKQHRLDLIVANDIKDVKKGTSRAFIIDAGFVAEIEGGKEAIAERILDRVIGEAG